MYAYPTLSAYIHSFKAIYYIINLNSMIVYIVRIVTILFESAKYDCNDDIKRF